MHTELLVATAALLQEDLDAAYTVNVLIAENRITIHKEKFLCHLRFTDTTIQLYFIHNVAGSQHSEIATYDISDPHCHTNIAQRINSWRIYW
jgi:hypothetical protein